METSQNVTGSDPTESSAAKWPIPEQATNYDWVGEQVGNDYSAVFSVTDDPWLLSELIRHSALTIDPRGDWRLLVAGCGTRTHLERRLLEFYPLSRVVATDFGPVVDVARARLSHDRLEYAAALHEDVPALAKQSGAFDGVFVVNSILSDSDSTNRNSLRALNGGLRVGGVLVGLFPTVFSMYEIGLLAKSEDHRLSNVNIATSRYYEKTQGTSQIFYTPLRLRQILAEAGFRTLEMEVLFLDSPTLLSESERIYGLSSDLALYELLVRAQAISWP